MVGRRDTKMTDLEKFCVDLYISIREPLDAAIRLAKEESLGDDVIVLFINAQTERAKKDAIEAGGVEVKP